MAVPVLGGLLIADEVVDIFLPGALYWLARRPKMQQERQAASGQQPANVLQPPVAAPAMISEWASTGEDEHCLS